MKFFKNNWKQNREKTIGVMATLAVMVVCLFVLSPYTTTAG